MALQNGGEHDPELRTARLEMAAEWLRRYARAEEILRRGSAVTGVREADHADRRIACREAADRPGREDRTEPAVPMRKREEVQEVLRCPGVGKSERTGAACALRRPVGTLPSAADRGTRRSLARPLADHAGRGPRSRRGGTGPAIVTGCHVNASGAQGEGGGEAGEPAVLRPAHMERLERAKASHISRTTRTTCG